MNETIKIIESLRTVRHFSNEEVLDKDLEIILKSCVNAASASCRQTYSNCVHRGDMNRIYDLLNLPKKHCFPSIALILGYPSEEEKAKVYKKGRLYGEGVIHYNKYKRLDNEGLKKVTYEYDSEDKDFLTLIKEWRDKGYKHYLDYFYEKWCDFRKTGSKSTSIKNNQYFSVRDMLIKAEFLDK